MSKRQFMQSLPIPSSLEIEGNTGKLKLNGSLSAFFVFAKVENI